MSDPPEQPSWLEAEHFGFLPRLVKSSRQKRLFSVHTGKVTIYPVGEHELRTSILFAISHAIDVGLERIIPIPVASSSAPQRPGGESGGTGYVCMLPLPLPAFTASPLRSKDDLALRMSLELSLSVLDAEAAIVSVVLSEGEQLECTQRQVLAELQRICADRDYSDIIRSLHEVGEQLMARLNEKVNSGIGGSFLIAGCAIVDCALEDGEIEEATRQRRRIIEESKKRLAEANEVAEFEALQAEIVRDKAARDREHAVSVQGHENAIQNLRLEAEAARQRMEAELKKARVALEAEMAMEASRHSVEIQRNMAEAEMQGMPVARAKAVLYASPGGPEILNRQDTFELKALEVRKQIEVLRAMLADTRFKDFMTVARNSGFTEAQVESLNNYQRLLERSFGAPETQINVPRVDNPAPGKAPRLPEMGQTGL